MIDITTIVLGSIIAIQWLYIIYKDCKFSGERKNMLDRIMAKDTNEYINLNNGEKVQHKSPNPLKPKLPEELRGYLK